MNSPKNHAWRKITLASCLLTPLLMTACSGLGLVGSAGSSTIRGSEGMTFSNKYATRAYQFSDKNTADVYLTDLSDDQLSAFFTDSGDWSQISGTLAQIHLFLKPKPGRTPIEPTAASASIRWIVISNGEIGVYDGAGFMIPGGNITKDSISGSIKKAPLRLTRKTPGFADPLITPEIDIKFATKLDEQSATELAARLQAMSAKAKPVQD